MKKCANKSGGANCRRLRPSQTLEASARSLVNQGVTNEAEFKRIFGL